MNKNLSIIKNKFGYHEVENKPSQKELGEFYSKKYYQESMGAYETKYPKEEIQYFENKNREKHFVIQKYLKNSPHSLLDIGCGEGWTLKYFKKLGWDVTGLDFSDFGCRQHNPDCLENITVGDFTDSIQKFIHLDRRFDVVWLDNVLEHVTEPLKLLKQCRQLINPGGVLVVEVPNDFSVLQQYLLKKKYIDNKPWVVLPDHLSYFNKDGLTNLADAAGWKSAFTMSEHPIDFNLLNENTNYYKDASKGKSCHKARIEIENLIHSISVEKSIDYLRALAELGLGRQIVAFYTPKKR